MAQAPSKIRGVPVWNSAGGHTYMAKPKIPMKSHSPDRIASILKSAVVLVLCLACLGSAWAQAGPAPKPDMYAVMKAVMAKARLEPDLGVYSQPGAPFTRHDLQALLINPATKEPGSWSDDTPRGWLTEADLAAMTRYPNQAWSVAKLGKAHATDKGYAFSIPQFTANGSKALVRMTYLVEDEPLYSETYLATLANGTWTVKAFNAIEY